MKIKTNSIFLKKGITFFLIFFCFIFCFSSDSVFADSSLNVSIDSNSINLDLAPKSSDGTFSKSDNLNISVSLTGPGGYMVGIRADSSTDLVNEDDDTKVFSSISSAVSESDFSSSSNTTYNNKWGYLPSKYNSIVNTNFLPAPSVNGDTIDYNETENVSGSYTISIGARADLETNTGTYDNTFIITAVANLSCSPSATNIREARCMQDVNDNVINSMETGTQYKLYDNRDWKTYYVAKMKDGRVWMTQNLDLDLETSPNNIAELTSENTDLNAFDSQGYTTANGYSCSNTSTSTNCTADGEVITWTPSKATVTTASDYGSNNNTAPASFDYGEVYRYVSTTGTTTSYSTKSACETAHNDGTCPHYHTGNYYNWTSVIASNNSSSITANYTTASNSICPAGWRLPEGRTSTTSTNPGYYSEINYTWVSEGLATNYVTGTGTATYGTSGWTNIRKNPMYMMASGYKNDTSAPSNLGSYGYYWTNTAYSSTTAYAPYIYSSGLYPAYYNSTSSARGRGLSVRCVAKQENTGSTVITFNKNSDDATGTMNNQSINANTFANLTTNNYIRSGYAFNSWNTEPNGSGDNYVDESQYYATVGTSNTNITLYAQWDKVYTVTFSTGSHVAGISFDGTYYTDGQTTQAIDGKTYTIGGDYDTKYGFDSWSITAGTLKNSNAPATTYTVSGDATITLNGKEATIDMTTLTTPSGPVSSNCKNEAIIPQLVYDPRDNEAYWIARLCDGNYWMLDNLRLDLTDSTVINSLSSTNTNATDIQLNYLKNGGGTTNDQYPISGLTGSNWDSGASYSAPLVRNIYKDDISPIIFGLGGGKVGVYYNFCAASAGSFCWGNGAYNKGLTSNPNPGSERLIQGDICPTGWHLPTFNNFPFSAYGNTGGTLGGETKLTQFETYNTALSVTFSSPTASTHFWSTTWADPGSIINDSIGITGNSMSINYSRNTPTRIRCLSSGETTITFDKNANNASGVMDDKTIFGGEYANLTANTYTREGYLFLGWNTEADGSGTDYADEERYTATEGANENITLYAQWEEAQIITFDIGNHVTGISFDGTYYTDGQTVATLPNSSHTIGGDYDTKYGFDSWSITAGTLKNSNAPATTYTVSGDATITLNGKEATIDMTTLTTPSGPVSSNCKNEAIIPQLVYDPRDNEAYWIARLCDGNYWMLDNLRLDLTDSTVINSLSSTNTNATDIQLNYLKNGGGTTNDQYPISGLTGSEWTSGYSYSVPRVAAKFKDDISSVTFGLGSGKVGVYYNYCAMSAGSYCWGNGTSSTGSPASDPNANSYRDIEGDICPVGWHLPNRNDEFQAFSSAYDEGGTLGGDTILTENLARKTALSTPLSGYFDNGLQKSLGGNFWSSTWYDTNNVRFATVSATGFSYSYAYRYRGNSIRCVLDSP